jgi:hypothetical protein
MFIDAIQGDRITITIDNVKDLNALADEFSFTELRRELSIWWLWTNLESKYRQFLSDLDNHQTPFNQLISMGLDRSISRKLLILAGGDFVLARSGLSQLGSLSTFASSIPIYECVDIDTMFQLAQQLPSTVAVSDIGFVSVGGVLYSFMGYDVISYQCMIRLVTEISYLPLTSDNVSDSVEQFYKAQWMENKAHESVFVMEGLSENAARKLMVLSRGRYCIAWQYFMVHEPEGSSL